MLVLINTFFIGLEVQQTLDTAETPVSFKVIQYVLTGGAGEDPASPMPLHSGIRFKLDGDSSHDLRYIPPFRGIELSGDGTKLARGSLGRTFKSDRRPWKGYKGRLALCEGYT